MSISAKIRNTPEYKKHLSNKVKEYYETNPNAKTITSKRFINYVNKKYGNNFKNTLYVKKDKE